MLRGRADDGMWNDIDRIMALALTAYEDGLCGGCGGHFSQTHGDENVGRWEANADAICHQCEAIEAFRENNKDTYPGQKLTVTDSFLLADSQ